MPHRALFLLVVLLLAPACQSVRSPTARPDSPSGRPDPGAPPVYVLMSTSLGDITVELDGARAPITVRNFLAYADRGEYDGTIFHRVHPGFVIQGGGRTPDLAERKSDKPIRNEWPNGLKNLRGTIAMARDADPDTATREFYFNLIDNPKLDTARDITGKAGYCVFGRVVGQAGMDTIDRIRGVEIRHVPEMDLQNVPIKAVVIRNVRRISADQVGVPIAARTDAR